MVRNQTVDISTAPSARYTVSTAADGASSQRARVCLSSMPRAYPTPPCMVDDMSDPTIRPSYDMWLQYNRRLREVIGAMSAEQLAVRPSPDLWPIWATVGHTAGVRVYWLALPRHR